MRAIVDVCRLPSQRTCAALRKAAGSEAPLRNSNVESQATAYNANGVAGAQEAANEGYQKRIPVPADMSQLQHSAAKHSGLGLIAKGGTGTDLTTSVPKYHLPSCEPSGDGSAMTFHKVLEFTCR